MAQVLCIWHARQLSIMRYALPACNQATGCRYAVPQTPKIRNMFETYFVLREASCFFSAGLQMQMQSDVHSSCFFTCHAVSVSISVEGSGRLRVRKMILLLIVASVGVPGSGVEGNI